jgi:hypothetical protein
MDINKLLAQFNIDFDNFEEVKADEFILSVRQLDVRFKVLDGYPNIKLLILKSIEKIIGIIVDIEILIKRRRGKRWYIVSHFFRLKNFDFNKYKP